MEELKNVPPMEQRRLVTYINNFIMTTVSFLNNFMVHCETKMMKSEQRLQQISASLCIVETKLNSIPELQEHTPQQILNNEPSNNQLEDNSHNTEVIKDESNKSKTEDIKVKQSQSEESFELDDDVKPKESIVDPTILKYRKMLQFGVPRGAVELKMLHEGLDPKLL